eukprot:comp19550_c0_seq1/m.22918 comp19550_c0_seq1/g.22918  ORF comp19550_c0_seq1/g.22918 comp19550_c0_seq1/m.22918 type:complete len:881 (-) comp19550_c0_seq1:307-2949(-)
MSRFLARRRGGAIEDLGEEPPSLRKTSNEKEVVVDSETEEWTDEETEEEGESEWDSEDETEEEGEEGADDYQPVEERESQRVTWTCETCRARTPSLLAALHSLHSEAESPSAPSEATIEVDGGKLTIRLPDAVSQQKLGSIVGMLVPILKSAGLSVNYRLQAQEQKSDENAEILRTRSAENAEILGAKSAENGDISASKSAENAEIADPESAENAEFSVENPVGNAVTDTCGKGVAAATESKGVKEKETGRVEEISKVGDVAIKSGGGGVVEKTDVVGDGGGERKKEGGGKNQKGVEASTRERALVPVPEPRPQQTPRSAGATPPHPNSRVHVEPKTALLVVGNMTGPKHASNVMRKLTSMAGVVDVNVMLPSSMVLIQYNAHKVKLTRIMHALAGMHFSPIIPLPPSAVQQAIAVGQLPNSRPLLPNPTHSMVMPQTLPYMASMPVPHAPQHPSSNEINFLATGLPPHPMALPFTTCTSPFPPPPRPAPPSRNQKEPLLPLPSGSQVAPQSSQRKSTSTKRVGSTRTTTPRKVKYELPPRFRKQIAGPSRLKSSRLEASTTTITDGNVVAYPVEPVGAPSEPEVPETTQFVEIQRNEDVKVLPGAKRESLQEGRGRIASGGLLARRKPATQGEQKGGNTTKTPENAQKTGGDQSRITNGNGNTTEKKITDKGIGGERSTVLTPRRGSATEGESGRDRIGVGSRRGEGVVHVQEVLALVTKFFRKFGLPAVTTAPVKDQTGRVRSVCVDVASDTTPALLLAQSINSAPWRDAGFDFYARKVEHVKTVFKVELDIVDFLYAFFYKYYPTSPMNRSLQWLKTNVAIVRFGRQASTVLEGKRWEGDMGILLIGARSRTPSQRGDQETRNRDRGQANGSKGGNR